MSSATSSYAQVDRRIGYFITLSDISGFTVAENSTYNAWTAEVITAANMTAIYGGGTAFAANQILEDMGEIAKVNGQIYRKVRKVTQTHAGGALPTFFIILPGGEYPIQGFPLAGGALPTLNTIANVARLG